jgi:hypothetical protein
MKSILLIFLCSLELLSCSSNSKKANDANTNATLTNWNANNYDNIGFACGEGGGKTELVEEFTNLIKDKNYKQIRSKLYSSKPGQVYLSTISCEKLSEEGLIKLKRSELEQIEKNRNKNDTIYTCSGCIESGYYTIKQLINDKANNMRLEAG